MSPKDCAYIVERLAIRFMAMVADHERQLAEHRTSFGARTEADAKIIAGLRAEIKQRAKEQDQDHKTIVSLISERDGLRVQVQDMREEIIRVNEAHGRTKVVHDGLLDELAVQRDAFTANVERIRCEGRDALRAEVAALKSQTPNQHGRWVRATSEKCTHAKAGEVVSVRGYLVRTNSGEFLWEGKDCEPCDPPQTAPVPKRAHPVAVGGYLRRLTGFNTTPAGEVARVTLVDGDESSQLEYEVVRPNGQKGRWSAKGCEPCDPPIVKREPTIGDTVRLVKIPIMGEVSPALQKVLEWPWIERWGTLNQTALVVEPVYPLEGALSVCLSTNVHVRWPICCVEVVAEATHDTEAGKAAAESGLLLNGGLDVRKVTT